MIYKELDPIQTEDRFAKAGRAAEEQMAFYFKRFFGDDSDILVLNGIRLEADGDAAQMDHLVIHSHGLAIVESKSVVGKLQIKDDGQWIRWYNNQSKGMASPITQARLQEKFLRTYLAKASNNPTLFEKFPIEIYIAISDSGVILWPRSGSIPNVCKADQVPDKIVASRREAKLYGAPELSAAGLEKIAAFLVASNKPLVKAAEAAQTAEVEPVVAEAVSEYNIESAAASDKPSCKNCGSNSLEIRFGHTYYWHCLSCEKNSSIKETCPTCKEPAKVRKQKKEFFLECGKCNHSSLYFMNP